MTEDAGEAQSGQPQFSEEGLGADRLMEVPPLTPGSGHLVCGLHHGRAAAGKGSLPRRGLYPWPRLGRRVVRVPSCRVGVKRDGLQTFWPVLPPLPPAMPPWAQGPL